MKILKILQLLPPLLSFLPPDENLLPPRVKGSYFGLRIKIKIKIITYHPCCICLSPHMTFAFAFVYSYLPLPRGAGQEECEDLLPPLVSCASVGFYSYFYLCIFCILCDLLACASRQRLQIRTKLSLASVAFCVFLFEDLLAGASRQRLQIRTSEMK